MRGCCSVKHVDQRDTPIGEGRGKASGDEQPGDEYEDGISVQKGEEQCPAHPERGGQRRGERGEDGSPMMSPRLTI